MYISLSKEVLKRIQAGLNQDSIVYSLIDKLDNKQSDALFLPAQGINLISGCSGSGKSALSILRAVYLSRKDATDNAGKTLVLLRNAQFMSIVQNSLTAQALKSIELNTFRLMVTDDVKAYLAHKFGLSLEEIKKKTLQCTGKTRSALISSAIDEVKQAYPSFAPLDIYSICVEEIRIITVESILDSDEYLKHIQLRSIKPHELLEVEVDEPSFYQFIFKIYVAYERLIKESKYAYDPHIMHYLWSELGPQFKSSSKFKHIIIDDANHVPSCVIKAIANHLAEDGSLTLFCDKLGFKSYPIYLETKEFLSRAQRVELCTNYRSQVQVHQLAHYQASNSLPTSVDEEFNGTKADAIKPKVLRVDSESAEDEQLEKLTTLYKDSKSIALLVSKSTEVTRLSKMMPYAQKLKDVSAFDLRMPKGVYIGTTLETKGITFDVVCMPFMSEEKFDTNFTPEDLFIAAKTIYTGINCAADEFYTLYSGKISKYLSPLLDHFEEG